VATELLIELNTVEPSAPLRIKRAAPRIVRPVLVELPAQPRVALRTRLESCGTGRVVLGVTRWMIALALVVAGYCAAAGINAGVELVSGKPSSDVPHVLAAAPTQK
jgi:hypothetical protein